MRVYKQRKSKSNKEELKPKRNCKQALNNAISCAVKKKTESSESKLLKKVKHKVWEKIEYRARKMIVLRFECTDATAPKNKKEGNINIEKYNSISQVLGLLFRSHQFESRKP